MKRSKPAEAQITFIPRQGEEAQRSVRSVAGDLDRAVHRRVARRHVALDRTSLPGNLDQPNRRFVPFARRSRQYELACLLLLPRKRFCLSVISRKTLADGSKFSAPPSPIRIARRDFYHGPKRRCERNQATASSCCSPRPLRSSIGIPSERKFS